MSASQVAIFSTGMVSAVGFDAPASCAAIRAKLANPSETRFADRGGEWIMTHQVTLDKPWRGLAKLAQMAAMAIDEALADVPKAQWSSIPLLLCVADRARPGRLDGLDDRLFATIEVELGARFAPQSAVVAQGRVGAGIALAHARSLIAQEGISRVLIAATDSLLQASTIAHYETADRLLTARNSDGFMPGEASCAMLVGRPGNGAQLICAGLGFGQEDAPIDSDKALRADGLTQAIKAALADARCALHDLHYRVTDLSGEQFYFKEAALAFGRCMRKRTEEFELWHPSESVGEAAAAAGAICIATAAAAARKRYAPGRGALVHLGNDSGQRAAIVLVAPEG